MKRTTGDIGFQATLIFDISGGSLSISVICATIWVVNSSHFCMTKTYLLILGFFV